MASQTLADVNNVSPFWRTNNLPQTIMNCFIRETKITHSISGMFLAFMDSWKPENMQHNGAGGAVVRAKNMEDRAPE